MIGVITALREFNSQMVDIAYTLHISTIYLFSCNAVTCNWPAPRLSLCRTFATRTEIWLSCRCQNFYSNECYVLIHYIFIFWLVKKWICFYPETLLDIVSLNYCTSHEPLVSIICRMKSTVAWVYPITAPLCNRPGCCSKLWAKCRRYWWSERSPPMSPCPRHWRMRSDRILLVVDLLTYYSHKH